MVRPIAHRQPAQMERRYRGWIPQPDLRPHLPRHRERCVYRQTSRKHSAFLHKIEVKRMLVKPKTNVIL